MYIYAHIYTCVHIYIYTPYILTHMHAHTNKTQMPEAVLQLENVIQVVWVGPRNLEHPAQRAPKQVSEEHILHLSSRKNSSFAVKSYVSEGFA